MGQGFRLEIHASPIFVPLTFASGYLFSVAIITSLLVPAISILKLLSIQLWRVASQ